MAARHYPMPDRSDQQGAFVDEQPALAGEAAAVAGQAPVRADDAVAGDHDGDGIRPVRGGHGADGRRPADLRGETRVRPRRARGNAPESAPDLLLEGCSARVDFDGVESVEDRRRSSASRPSAGAPPRGSSSNENSPNLRASSPLIPSQWSSKTSATRAPARSTRTMAPAGVATLDLLRIPLSLSSFRRISFSSSSLSFSSCATLFVRERRPQVQRRVRAVRAPALGPRHVVPSRDACPLEGTDDAEVARRKRVPLAECAERDDVRRPRPESGQGRQALLEVVEAARRREDGTTRPPRRGRSSGGRRRGRAAGRRARRPLPRPRAGVGKTCVRPGRASRFGSGRPQSATSRPASVRAPATEICWPRTARTAISNGSHAPGTRRPGRRATSGARRGSPERTLAIARGSAERSKRREVRVERASALAHTGNSCERKRERPRRRSSIRSSPGAPAIRESPFIGILFDSLDPRQRPRREEGEEAPHRRTGLARAAPTAGIARDPFAEFVSLRFLCVLIAPAPTAPGAPAAPANPGDRTPARRRARCGRRSGPGPRGRGRRGRAAAAPTPRRRA